MSERFDLLDYLRPLLRWWWLLAAAVIVAMLTSFIYVARQPPIFIARATLLVGSSIQDLNPNGSELYLASQLAETYADIANRAPLRQATMEALGMSWLPNYSVSQIAGRPVIEVQVHDEDPQRAYLVAQEMVRQVILLGPQGEQGHQEFVGQQLSKLQASITETEALVVQRENELLAIDSASKLAAAQAEITALQEKMTTLQQNYANLLATTQRGAVNSLRVLEPPLAPTTPISSGLLQNMVIAAALAFVLAASGAYLLEYLDNTFRDGDEMKRVLDVNLLGTTPNIPGADGHSAQSLILLQLGPTPTGEAYRRIRTDLEFAAVDRALQVILITSAESRDGKSLTAANLSISLANGGKNVVLLDADLHRPSQQRLFKLQNHAGLTTTLLSEGDNLEGLLHGVGVPRLKVLTSGPLPPNPAELLGSRRFHEVLAKLRDTTDVIVIDSPPLTAVVDSLILSAQVDGLLMIIRAGKTHRDSAKRALAALQQVQARTLGAIFSDVPGPQMDLYNQKYGYYNVAYSRKVAMGKPAEQASAPGKPPSQPQAHTTYGNGKSTVATPDPAPADQSQRTDFTPSPTGALTNGSPEEPVLTNADGLQVRVNGTFKQIVRRRPSLPWQ